MIIQRPLNATAELRFTYALVLKIQLQNDGWIHIEFLDLDIGKIVRSVYIHHSLFLDFIFSYDPTYKK